jgi:hypothetical protein
MNDDEPMGYVMYEKEAAKEQAIMEDTFADAFEEWVAGEPLLVDGVGNAESNNTSLSLHPPRILPENIVSQRAEAHAKGNIWMWSLIATADRVLETHSLNASMMAAQQKLEMIRRESQEAQNEIQNLRKKHELLKSAWASVDQAANKRDTLRTEQKRLESELHGGGTIDGALSERFQAVPSSGFIGMSKQPRSDSKEVGLDLFALLDTSRSLVGRYSDMMCHSTNPNNKPNNRQDIGYIQYRNCQ